MREAILIIGLAFCIWGALGTGVYHIIMKESIPEQMRLSSWIPYSFVIGAIITFIAAFYIIGVASRENSQKENQYEPITYTVYKKK